MSKISTRDRILKALKKEGGRLTSGQIARVLNVRTSVAAYHLQQLRKEGVLDAHGRGINGGYSLAQESPAPTTNDFTLEDAQEWVTDLQSRFSDTPKLDKLMNEPSPFEAPSITVSVEHIDSLKDLPFSVGLAAAALLSNDVPAAKRVLLGIS